MNCPVDGFIFDVAHFHRFNNEIIIITVCHDVILVSINGQYGQYTRCIGVYRSFFLFSARAAKQKLSFSLFTPSEAVLPLDGCVSFSNNFASSTPFSNSIFLSFLVPLIPPLFCFILPFGVTGNDGK